MPPPQLTASTHFWKPHVTVYVNKEKKKLLPVPRLISHIIPFMKNIRESKLKHWSSLNRWSAKSKVSTASRISGNLGEENLRQDDDMFKQDLRVFFTSYEERKENHFRYGLIFIKLSPVEKCYASVGKWSGILRYLLMLWISS